MASKVKYTLNLPVIFDRAYKQESQLLRNKLRPLLSDPMIKRAYGLAVIDEIARRCREDYKDKKEKAFKPYKIDPKTKKSEYMESHTYKVYKGRQRNVDLTLTGSMLDSMEANIDGRNSVVVHYPDQEENDKAHGHINGTRRKDGKIGLPVRDFLGLIPEKEELLLRDTLKNEARSRAMSDVAQLIQGVEFDNAQG